ncbi:hypothetical protein [Streptomyces sp. NPDC006012]|uniref:hypothetical protein n=1 Tax=Streptomyces sp. NPDC006012 TaxID=3364739 RepID=UPI0036CE5A55
MPFIPDEAILALLENRPRDRMPKEGEPVKLSYRNEKGEDKEISFTWSKWVSDRMTYGRVRGYSDKMKAALGKHGYEPEYDGRAFMLHYDPSLIPGGQSGNSQGRGESSVSSVGQSGSADARLYPGSGYPAGISPQDHAVLPSVEHGQSGDFGQSNWVDSVQDYYPFERQIDDFFPVDQDGYLDPPPVFLNQGAGSQGFSDQAHGNFGQFPTGGYDPNIGDVSGPGNPFARQARGTESQFGWTGRRWQPSSQGERTDQRWQAPSQGKGKASRR